MVESHFEQRVYRNIGMINVILECYEQFLTYSLHDFRDKTHSFPSNIHSHSIEELDDPLCEHNLDISSCAVALCPTVVTLTLFSLSLLSHYATPVQYSLVPVRDVIATKNAYKYYSFG